MTPRDDDSILQASLAAVRCLIDTEGSAGVVELAAAAGVSRRTWHRYFPAKEDLIRPTFRDVGEVVLRAVAEREPTTSIVDAWVSGFSMSAGGLFTERTRGLMPLIVRSSSLSAVLDNEGALMAARLREEIARQTSSSSDADDLAAALATTLVALSIAALRDAVTAPEPPHVILRRRIAALRLAETIPSVPTGERRTR